METFRRLRADYSTPAGQLVDTAIRLDQLDAFPKRDLIRLGEELEGQYVAHAVLRMLTIRHSHLFEVAYHQECAFCRFRHEELLDAAHIVPDTDPLGEPVVSNGLALCRLHHAAFDRYFVGVRPDLHIAVRPDLLSETDGPTLVHGIAEFLKRAPRAS